jgi:hypothetical protein
VTRKRINILTPPLEDQNVRAFLAPLLANRGLLSDAGFDLRLYRQIDAELTDCDILVLNSSYWRGPWAQHRTKAVDLITELVERAPLTLFFDRASTSGTITAAILPLVKRYYKTSLLRDRSLYLRPLYGLRQFTDYYHHNDGVVDREPNWSDPIEEPNMLHKLRLSWSTALANYSLLGPRISALYEHLPFAYFMRPSSNFIPPSLNRSIDVSCRMGLNYKYETVGHQRRRLAEVLQKYRRVDRISKFAYFRELRNSKIVTSPFGYSEVNYKDFETFISGGLLLKPDMSHLETYPDLFQDDVTFVSHDWDLSNLEEKVDRILSDYPRYLEIAANGQDTYRSHTVGRDARERFVNYFLDLLDEAAVDDGETKARSADGLNRA